jgi:hypothetical protein
MGFCRRDRFFIEKRSAGFFDRDERHSADIALQPSNFAGPRDHATGLSVSLNTSKARGNSLREITLARR